MIRVWAYVALDKGMRIRGVHPYTHTHMCVYVCSLSSHYQLFLIYYYYPTQFVAADCVGGSGRCVYDVHKSVVNGGVVVGAFMTHTNVL